MFYFAHPFGISTPSSVNQSFDFANDQAETPKEKPNKKIREKYASAGGGASNHMETYIPWPEDTWKRDNILAPLVQLLAQQLGKFHIHLILL